MKRTVGLWVILACLAATFSIGFALKKDCASGAWTGQQYTHLCYTDIVPLYDTEHLTGNRIPYLDACPVSTDGECDEYPVLTMFVMRGAAWSANTHEQFFYSNALVLVVAAIVIATCLYMVAGSRALFFALAPTLAIYGLVNWDLLAVAFATAATVTFARKRNVWTGVLLGLGAAAKFYPALLLVPFVLDRFHEKDPDGGIHMVWAAAGTWLAVNLPFAVLAPHSWFEFFRFNSTRGADWDSLWFMGCNTVTHQQYCPGELTKTINVTSAALFVAFSVLVYWLRRSRDRGFARWTFAFPFIVLFLLTNKVYSPQYGLWLLPLFALALPDWRLFVPFEIADIAVFVTRFSFFGKLSGAGGFPSGHGTPFSWFEIAILARAVILLICLVAWIRRPSEKLRGVTTPAVEPALPESPQPFDTLPAPAS